MLQTLFLIFLSLLPVLHSHAGKLYDSPGILLVRVMLPVMAAASFTFMLSFLFAVINSYNIIILSCQACGLLLATCGLSLVTIGLKPAPVVN